MSLTPTEVARVKNYLGYGNMNRLALPYIDTARVFEEIVQRNVDPAGEQLIRERYLPNLDNIDKLIGEAPGTFVASKVDEVEIDPQYFRRLLRARGYWLDRLADTVRVQRNDSAADMLAGRGGARVELG